MGHQPGPLRTDGCPDGMAHAGIGFTDTHGAHGPVQHTICCTAECTARLDEITDEITDRNSVRLRSRPARKQLLAPELRFGVGMMTTTKN